MTKPRIIIADTDANYVIPLQTKFAEEYQDDIELEIITDPAYFHTLFQTPQKVDILILAEELFDPSLQKHNIASIFLMTEQMAEGMTTDLRENRIFKYSNIREIFNEITGKSADSLRFQYESRQKPKLIVVTGSVGGAGRTTTAMGICAGLFRQYKRTLYLDAEALQTFQILLTEKEPISDNSIYFRLMQQEDHAYEILKSAIRTEVFDYLPPFRAALLSLGLGKHIYRMITEQALASGDYDYVVLDTDTVFDEEKAALMQLADKVVIVTEQGAKAVHVTNLLTANISDANSDKFLYLCNRFDRDADNYLLEEETVRKFKVDEYVRQLDRMKTMRIDDFLQIPEYQKIAFLL